MEQKLAKHPRGVEREDTDVLESTEELNAKPSVSIEPDVLEEGRNVTEKQGRQRASMKATGRVAQTSLPVGEEDDDDPFARKAELEERITELESTMRYMGTGHPKRSTYEIQLRSMQDMLKRIEDALNLAR